MPITDEEIAAVEDGIRLHEQLVQRLADVPTPAGPTPRELNHASFVPLALLASRNEPADG